MTRTQLMRWLHTAMRDAKQDMQDAPNKMAEDYYRGAATGLRRALSALLRDGDGAPDPNGPTSPGEVADYGAEDPSV
jgi:hypothetical protein